MNPEEQKNYLRMGNDEGALSTSLWEVLERLEIVYTNATARIFGIEAIERALEVHEDTPEPKEFEEKLFDEKLNATILALGLDLGVAPVAGPEEFEAEADRVLLEESAMRLHAALLGNATLKWTATPTPEAYAEEAIKQAKALVAALKAERGTK